MVSSSGMPACDGSRSRIGARSAEDHGLDLSRATIASTIARMADLVDGRNCAFQELAQILVVKECLFLLGGQGNGKSAVGEDVRVERRLHREARAEECRAAQPERCNVISTASTMLTRGMGERRCTSSNTMCGVLAQMMATSASAAARR